MSQPNSLLLNRRHVLAAAMLAPVAAPALALPVPPQGRIAFRMLRDGDVIGSHVLRFTRQGEALSVAVEIDILVKFGPVPVYRYSHRATETWEGDRFMAIESRTNNDGEAAQMRAVRGAEGVVVEGSKTQRYVAPEDALPSTYWNKAMLSSRLINSEDGRLFRVAVAERGEEAVPLANGGTLAARHYGMTGDLVLEIWYDAAGQWAHLAFTTKGSTIVYQKQ